LHNPAHNNTVEKNAFVIFINILPCTKKFGKIVLTM